MKFSECGNREKIAHGIYICMLSERGDACYPDKDVPLTCPRLKKTPNDGAIQL